MASWTELAWPSSRAAYARTYWQVEGLLGQINEAGEEQTGEKYVGPAWRAQLTRRLAFAREWMNEHQPPAKEDKSRSDRA